jgi:hypothetical protein
MLGIIVQTAWSMRSEVTVKVRIPFPAATGGYFTMPDHKRVACQIAALASAVLYFFVVAALASYAFLRPKNNWDVLPYAGVITSWRTSDADAIHRDAYASIRGLPEYAVLVGTGPVSEFKQDIFSDSIHFVEQLPFYSIKPLYCLLVAGLHRLGFSFPQSMAIISVSSFVVLCVLTWFWLRRYLIQSQSMAFAVLLVISPPIYEVARLASPDALGLMLFALALYLFLESSHAVTGGTVLLVALWVRPDSLILAGLLFCVLLLLKKIDLAEWFTFCAMAVVSYCVIRVFAGPYSWSVLFHNSFVAALTEPGNAIVEVTPRTYFFTIAQNGWTLLKSTSLTLVFLMGLLALMLHRRRSYRFMTATILLSEILHFVMYPSIEHRFYTLSTFFFPLSLVLACQKYFLRQGRCAWSTGEMSNDSLGMTVEAQALGTKVAAFEPRYQRVFRGTNNIVVEDDG